jgi:hypothetical protein
MDGPVAGLDRLEHRRPLPFDGGAVGVELDLQPRLLEHPLAGGDVGGQAHPHADRHHAQIHDHLHGCGCEGTGSQWIVHSWLLLTRGCTTSRHS